MSVRVEKICGLLKELAAKFIQEESGGDGLITVSNCHVSPDLKNATIFITVFPENKENEAMDFIKKSMNQIRHYISQKTKIRAVPRLRFEIDLGEKSRNRIDQLLHNL